MCYRNMRYSFDLSPYLMSSDESLLFNIYFIKRWKKKWVDLMYAKLLVEGTTINGQSFQYVSAAETTETSNKDHPY